MTRKVIVIGLAVGALLITPATAYAATPPGQVISMTVRDLNGMAAPGAHVLVTILPTGSSENTPVIKLGSRGTAVADSHGKLSLSLVPTDAERSLAAVNGDWLNVQLTYLDSNGLPIGSVTTPTYIGSLPDQAAEAARLAQRNSELRANQNAVNASYATTTDGGFSSAAVQTSGYIDTCINYRWVHEYTDTAFVKVGEIHTTTDVNTHSFSYGNRADSSIDVGFKYSDGSWNLGGELHVGNSLTQTFYLYADGDNQHWNAMERFYFYNYTLYADCQSWNWHSGAVGQSMIEADHADPQSGVTKSYVLTQPTRQGAYTVTLYANGGWSRYTEDFTKWSVGAGVFGITVGASSGASSFVQIYYRMGNAKSIHYIYGNNALPATSTRVFQQTP